MIRIEERSSPPHLFLAFEGQIAVSHINDTQEEFLNALRHQRPGFALVIDTLRLTGFDLPALGVMFYTTRMTYRARPGALVFINGGRFVNPRLKRLVERITPPETLHMFSTPAEALDFLNAFCNVHA